MISLDPMRPADVIHGDRRIESRYYFAMELRFSFQKRGVTYFGSGHTQDLSRYGVRFITESPPPDGTAVELRLAWPFLLQNVCRLQLVVRGPVVEVGERGTLVGIDSYEFQTCGERSFAAEPAIASNCSVG